MGSITWFLYYFGLIIDKVKKPFIKLLHFDKWPNLFSTVQKIITFSLVAFAWIFFRAKNFSDAIYITAHLFTKLHHCINDIIANAGSSRVKDLYLNNNKQVFIIAIFSILFMELVHYYQRKIKIREIISNKPVWLRWSIYYIFIMLILLFGEFEKSQQFIYFQF